VYGAVYRAKDKFTGKVYAIKKVKLNSEKEGFPITSLREINLLKSMRHPNIINIEEVVMGKSFDQIFLVMEYAEHELRDLIQHYHCTFSLPEIKCLMKQLLEAVAYIHSKDIIHRDLKTSNLLYTKKGLLKVCDFGLSRKFMGSKRSYTPTVVTLTYRAPEVLLGCDTYTSAIDMWSVGCIFAELLLGAPLFRGKNEPEHIDLIFKTLGTPTTATWPSWKQLKFAKFFEGKNYNVNNLYEIFAGLSFGDGAFLSENGLELLEHLLTYDPSKRMTATEALRHPWFKEEPLPKEPEQMPVFPATNEIPRSLTKKLCVNNSKVINKN
jgi:cell division cycle 2-like protein